MLYYKHGTLAEDRFKNLTPAQWLFHYMEIMKYRRQEQETQIDVTKEALKAILDRIDMLTLFISPERGQKFFELKELRKHEAELPAEKFGDSFEKLKGFIPPIITATHEEKKSSSIPKVKRQRQTGIISGEGGY